MTDIGVSANCYKYSMLHDKYFYNILKLERFMSLTDNVFDKNFSYVNKITFRILFFANITTIVIFILTLLHVFSVDLRYCLFLFGYSCVCTIVSNLLHLLKMEIL